MPEASGVAGIAGAAKLLERSQGAGVRAGPALHRADEGGRVGRDLVDQSHDRAVLEVVLHRRQAVLRRGGVVGGVGPGPEALVGADLGASGVAGGVERRVDVEPVAPLRRAAAGEGDADAGERGAWRELDLQVLGPPAGGRGLLGGGAPLEADGADQGGGETAGTRAQQRRAARKTSRSDCTGVVGAMGVHGFSFVAHAERERDPAAKCRGCDRCYRIFSACQDRTDRILVVNIDSFEQK